MIRLFSIAAGTLAFLTFSLSAKEYHGAEMFSNEEMAHCLFPDNCMVVTVNVQYRECAASHYQENTCGFPPVMAYRFFSYRI